MGVYIPPKALSQEAQRSLAEQVSSLENSRPNSVILVVGDFNMCNLSHELPSDGQPVTCATRPGNILDQVFSAIKQRTAPSPSHQNKLGSEDGLI